MHRRPHQQARGAKPGANAARLVPVLLAKPVSNMSNASTSPVSPYCLGVVTEPSGETKAGFDATIDISADEYRDLAEACRDLGRLLHPAIEFRVLERNYGAFEDCLHFSVLALSVGLDQAAPDRPTLAEGVLVSLVNWLNAMRWALDGAEAAIKRRLGDQSEAWARFDEETGTAYDNNTSYRICGWLRNRLHTGPLPLQIELARDTTGATKHRASFTLDRDQLLDRFEGPSLVRQDLTASPPAINVASHVRAAMTDMRNIARVVEDIWLDVALAAVPRLSDAIRRVRETSSAGTPAVFEWVTGPGGHTIHHVLIQEPTVHGILEVSRGERARASIWTEQAPFLASDDATLLPDALEPGLSLLATWVREGSATDRFTAAVREMFAQPHGDQMVVDGLVGTAAAFAHMAASLFGVPVESMVAGLARDQLGSPREDSSATPHVSGGDQPAPPEASNQPP